MASLRNLSLTDKQTAEKYRHLNVRDSVVVTYIWVDDFGNGEDIRGKSRVFKFEPKKPEDLPLWSHGRMPTAVSEEDPDLERMLKPVAMYNDPFRGGKDKLVLCEITDTTGRATRNNFRRRCSEIMNQAKDQKPWFGMEQEYILFDLDGHPFGWPKRGAKIPDPKLPYPTYCAVGAEKVVGRDVCEAHLNACLHAGLDIFGTNAESLEAQWEYQLGPVEGIAAADQLWISRYILHRVAEDFGLIASMGCKPIAGYNGNGCHTNFSTKAMREEGGIKEIYKAIDKLKENHFVHLACYGPDNGKDNERRFGTHAAPPLEFSSDVASRVVSVRIPLAVHAEGKGYLEDRRPAGNCDPYLVTAALVETCCIGKEERPVSKL